MCLDPSLRNTGVAILDTENGVKPKKIVHTETVSTDPKKKDYYEIGNAIARINHIFKEYDPALVVSELPYSSQSFKGGVSVGYSWAISAMLRAYSVRPQDIEKMIKGYIGKSKKRKAIGFVAENLYPKASFWDTDKMNHIADAICAYFVYLQKERFLNFDKDSMV